ncbi:PREDICTED: uncharacterized protein LOC106819081 [Priapulus caudatus]|uniref:L-Fucosyltransferase n=1 Tax=Priapulus caudatus TaxID=37621 RepID=A0ABM1F456_PRICU|nr:PREDICTED: uncharacterized protein LOC106819081 [Priapulus caudatus]
MAATTAMLFVLSLLIATASAAEGKLKDQDDEFLYGEFSKDFVWATATAAYQIEGGWDEDGKGPSVWDTISHAGHVLNGDTGDVACDSYHKYMEDVMMNKAMGMQELMRAERTERIFRCTSDNISTGQFEGSAHIVLRLGEFHTEMSYLGRIGHLMAGSGLQEVLELTYASNSVSHMLTVEEFTFQKADQAVTIASKSTMKIKEQAVKVDPQLIFQRLVFVGERSGNLPSLFKYELCGHPPALFDSYGLPLTARKPALADALSNIVEEVQREPSLYHVDFDDDDRPRVAKDSSYYLKQIVRDNGFLQKPEPEATARGAATSHRARPPLDGAANLVWRSGSEISHDGGGQNDAGGSLHPALRESSRGADFQPIVRDAAPPSGDVDVRLDDVTDWLTVVPLGRLGNQMFQYATLLGVANVTGRTPVLMRSMGALKQAFNIRTPTADIPRQRRHQRLVKVPFERSIFQLNATTNALWGFFNSWFYFNHVRDQVALAFTFRDAPATAARRLLSDLAAGRGDVTFVGVHVRRGDYVTKWTVANRARTADERYLAAATRYYRRRYANPLFVVCSDDVAWCRRNVRGDDIVYSDVGHAPADDLAVLAQCNHTIMTQGSFGWWGAYLSPGEKVYFTDYFEQGARQLALGFDYVYKFPPHWIGISPDEGMRDL